MRTYINREYAQFEDIVLAWLDALTEPRPTESCLAVAAPPFDDRVTMLNVYRSAAHLAQPQGLGIS